MAGLIENLVEVEVEDELGHISDQYKNLANMLSVCAIFYTFGK